jgi:hypothetical protein
LAFALYDADVAGTELYREVQSVVIDEGRFTAHIGDVTTLDLSLFRDHTDVWVGIAVDGGTELPRFALGTVPYAAYAEYAGDATTVGGTGLSGLQARVADACSAGESIRSIADDGTVACEPDTDTTYAPGTGLSHAGTTVAITPAAVQVRVTSSCDAGSAIRAIADDGTVTCEPDDQGVTSVVPGAGLSGSTTAGVVSLAVDTAAIQARVTGTCDPKEAISAIDEAGQVTCEAMPTALSRILVTESVSVPASSASGDVEADCDDSLPTTDSVISGACSPGNSSVDLAGAIPDLAGNAWRCNFFNPTAVQRVVTAYAVCGELQ